MWNFFTSKIMVASLLGASSVFGQNCKPICEPVCCEPHELMQCPTVAGYNSPSRIDIQCGWDVWVDASFIYWQTIQENMEPAMSHASAITTSSGMNNIRYVDLAFKYKPGFKIQLGMSFDYDNWDTSIEYTRLHGDQHRSAAMSSTSALAGAGYAAIWPNIINDDTTQALLCTAFKATWRLNLDFLDIDLGRLYYAGTQLTFRPSIGARVAWINQKRYATYTNILNSGVVDTDQEKTNSWGIGPRARFDMNWMVGKGFRFFGNNSFDLLFTRYKVIQSSLNSIVGSIPLFTGVEQKNVNTLRPHIDLELGIGWGTYLDCHRWHLDMSATYGYQVFWNQNMFRYSPGSFRALNPDGDLYVHGLTASVKLDF
jgi:hypothetical protein